MRVSIIFGTRPEAIKLAPVISELQKRKAIETITIATAQHREMLDQVLDVFNIKPNYDLNLMKDNQSLSDVTADVVKGIERLLVNEHPDIVLVQGDTTTAFSSALAAYYQKIKIGHIEAGLRTGNKYSPFPEEINRRIISVLADYHFAPTERAKMNLLEEGIKEERIFVTGNTVVDALLMTVEKVNSKGDKAYAAVFDGIDFNKKIILVTGHRRENFGEGIQNICHALKEIAGRNPDVQIVYPVHLNPNVRNPIYELIGDTENVLLLEPLDYEHFIYLMSRCYIILTDSGGIQEEAPSLGKPVLVMRDTTERPEAIEAGTAKLVGVDKNRIINEAQLLLNDKTEYKKMALAVNPYGDGKAGQRIVGILSGHLNEYSKNYS